MSFRRICIISPRKLPPSYNKNLLNSPDEDRAFVIADCIKPDEVLEIDLIMLAKKGQKFPTLEFKHKKVNVIYIENPWEDVSASFRRLIGNFLSKVFNLRGDTIFEPLYYMSFSFLIKIYPYLKKSDITYFSVAPFNFLAILLSRLCKAYTITDTYGIYVEQVYRNFKNSKGVSKIIELLKLIFGYIIEFFHYHIAHCVIALSSQHKLVLQNFFKIPERKIEILPIPVNLQIQRILSKEEYKQMRKQLSIAEDETVICFIGNFFAAPNLDALEYIKQFLYPQLLQKGIKVKFLICGAYPEFALENTDNRFIFTGFVSDIENYVGAADICISPLRLGSGTKTKVLTYLACGKPTIATAEGTNYIDVKDGHEILIVSLSEFPKAIQNLIYDKSLAQKIGENGRKFIERYHSLEYISDRLYEVFRKIEKIKSGEARVNMYFNR